MQTLGLINIQTLNDTKLDHKIIHKIDNKTVKIWNLNTESYMKTGLLIDNFLYYYSGEILENGNLDGNGELIYNDNPLIKKYIGSFINGIKSGNGHEEYMNGDIYTGSFKNNKRNGNGRLFSSTGIIKYEGNWINDKIDGYITGYDYDNKNKKKYFGCLENGLANGLGVVIKNDKVIQVGIYENNKIISKLDFYEKETSKILKIKASKYEDKYNEIEELTKCLHEPYDIKKLELFKPYLINLEVDKIKLYTDEGLIFYEGDVMVTLIKKSEDSSYVFRYMFNGDGIYRLYHKDDNNMLNYILEGKFEEHKFINGKIYTKRFGKEHILCNGSYSNLIIHPKILQNEILINFIEGSYYITSSRYVFGGQSKKQLFIGTMNKGHFVKGKIYIIIDETTNKLYYEGNFDRNTNIQVGNFRISGHGTEYWISTGNKKYEGDWLNDKYQGEGITFYENKDSIEYMGDFIDGNRHGNGSLYNIDGLLIYDGIFDSGSF